MVMQPAFRRRIQLNYGAFVQILRSKVTDSSAARGVRQQLAARQWREVSFVLAVIAEQPELRWIAGGFRQAQVTERMRGQ